MKFKLILLSLFVSFGLSGQINSRVKSIYFENADSVTVRANAAACGDCGFIYYNNDDTTNAKFRVYQDSVWYNLLDLSGGSTLYFKNGLNKRPDSTFVEWGGSLIRNTTIANGAFTINFSGVGNIGFSSTARLAVGGLLIQNGTNFNTVIGGGVLPTITGLRNTVFGYISGFNSTTGDDNAYFGRSTGNAITTGSGNTALGTGALSQGAALTGDYNINVGYFSGQTMTGDADNNIVIGSGNGGGINPASLTGDNQLNIMGAIWGVDNAGTNNNLSEGAIGIYEKSPTYSLHVSSPLANLDPFLVETFGGAKIIDCQENAGVVNIGLYGVTPTPQYATGATLTNNITSGGTANQTTDWTSLTVYATDATALRNSVYQMAEKIKKLEAALKLLGICID